MKKVLLLSLFTIPMAYSLQAQNQDGGISKVTMADIEALVPKAEKYRVGLNLAIIALEFAKYFSKDRNYADTFVDDHYNACLRTISLIKLPLITISATVEFGQSLPGVITDLVAATGMKGFWADTCLGYVPREADAIFIGAVLLSSVVATLCFNALNKIIQKYYPVNIDESKRRIWRSIAIIVSNLLVPTALFCLDAADAVYFRGRDMVGMLDIVFWSSVINNLTAEAVGHVIAQYVKEKRVFS